MHTMCFLIVAMGLGLERPEVEFQVFQFPANQIPRIDGNADDWSIVPDTYAIGADQLRETVVGIGAKHDPENLDVKVRVGAFWNLSHKTTMYGDASDLVAFRLMPIEKQLRKPVEANWSFQVVSQKDRVVAFRDRSYGNIASWRWDFGDGESSTERHPIHRYEKPGEFIVTLYVEGPDGKARRTKMWDVTLP